jgi:hypothetical protein
MVLDWLSAGCHAGCHAIEQIDAIPMVFGATGCSDFGEILRHFTDPQLSSRCSEHPAALAKLRFHQGFVDVARPAGLEPATPGLEGRLQMQPCCDFARRFGHSQKLPRSGATVITAYRLS